MEAREKLARHLYKEFCGGSFDDEPAWFKAEFYQKVDRVLSLLGDSHRPVSGSEPEKASSCPICDKYGIGACDTDYYRAEFKKASAESVPGSGSPHRSEALEIREALAHAIEAIDAIPADIFFRHVIAKVPDWKGVSALRATLTSGAPASDGRECWVMWNTKTNEPWDPPNPPMIWLTDPPPLNHPFVWVRMVEASPEGGAT